MCRFYIALLHHCVLQGRINPLMPQKPLKLFDRHTLIDCHCRQRPPGLVRMHFRNVQPLAHLTEPMFNSANPYPLIRGTQCHKERGVIIRPAVQIFLQMQLCAGVKVHDPLLIAFAEHHALALRKIDVIPVQKNHFPDTHSR